MLTSISSSSILFHPYNWFTTKTKLLGAFLTKSRIITDQARQRKAARSKQPSCTPQDTTDHPQPMGAGHATHHIYTAAQPYWQAQIQQSADQPRPPPVGHR